jgi:adenylate cyclase
MADESALVLVVDDNEMNRDMLSRRLQRQNYQVLMAEDGEKALEMIRANAFDLVLLDIMMPKLSGYEVLERVKKDDQTRHLPVIMISAVDDLDSVVKCIELGAEDYLFKPFNPVLLKARVSASLEKNRLRKGSSGGAIASHVGALKADVTALLAGDLSAGQRETAERMKQTIETLAGIANG